MNLQTAEQQLATDLATIYEPAEAAAIASLAMEHLTGLNRSGRRLQQQQALSPAQSAQWTHLQQALLQHQPIQYVIGEAWFYGMALAVSPAVLIPRPETEELVQWILQDEQHRPTASLIDIGTGSGCIAIALAKHWLQATVHAIDISEEALAMARQNAARQQVPVQWWHSSILEPARWPAGRFDIIVSNPPYIPQQESQLLDAHVVKWEPGLALFVPNDDPLLFYQRIAAFAQDRLLPGGRLYFECHQSYAGQVAALLSSMGFATTLRQDLFGNERMVRGEKLM